MAAFVFTAPMSRAQVPFIVVDDAIAFEGNSGTTVLKFPVRFIGTQNTTVSGFVSVIPFTAVGVAPATGGTVCGGNVDFEQFSNVPFSIPPNTPAGTLSVNVAVCGDSTIELDEKMIVIISVTTGASCSLEGACSAVGTIVNDDGPPAIQINNISISTLEGASRTANFTVSLHHPSPEPVSVNFVTRDGTARARTTTTLGSYIGRSGTLVIPANTFSATIPVTVLGTGGGTFFMDLSSPVNGTLSDATGQATIRILTLSVGSFDLTPDDARVTAGEVVNYSVTWTAPEGEVWRDIETIDFRLRKGNDSALWVEWDEASNTFKVCQPSSNGRLGSDQSDVTCTAGELPGSSAVLGTPRAELVLAQTSVVGSGPTGRTVTLNFAVRFTGEAAGNYTVELGGVDDFGNVDDFFTASKVHVERSK